jgi:hypothetical protein
VLAWHIMCSILASWQTACMQSKSAKHSQLHGATRAADCSCSSSGCNCDCHDHDEQTGSFMWQVVLDLGHRSRPVPESVATGPTSCNSE